MYPYPQNLGLAAGVGADTAHADEVSVEIRDEEVAAGVLEAAAHVRQVGKLAGGSEAGASGSATVGSAVAPMLGKLFSLVAWADGGGAGW